jgi:hypothetical protein
MHSDRKIASRSVAEQHGPLAPRVFAGKSSPLLLIPSNFCLRPVVYSPGTIPSHAENPRPFLKAAPLPIVAMIAVAVTGPMPGIATSRRQASFSAAALLFYVLTTSSVYEPEFSSNVCNSEANSVINSYNALSSSQQQDLLNFLRSL